MILVPRSEECLKNEHRDAAQNSDRKESLTAPSGCNADQERCCSGKRGLCRLDYRRECHDGERNIRNII